MKRTHMQLRKAILNTLSDSKEHSYENLEREVNSSWKTLRDHCEELEVDNFVRINEKKRITITKKGIEILKRLQYQRF